MLFDGTAPGVFGKNTIKVLQGFVPRFLLFKTGLLPLKINKPVIPLEKGIHVSPRPE